MATFGEVLREIGEFGFFQKALVAALCITISLSFFDLFGQVFTGLSFPYHCNTDWILELAPNLTQERQRNLTLPLSKDGQFESCKMFTPVDWDLETIEVYGINSTTECVNGWDYDAPKGATSLMTEFNLVCDNSGLIEVSQFGRRFTILLILFVLLFGGVGAALSPNIYIYMFFRFFCGSSGVIVATVCGLAVEWTDPSKAALCTTMIIFLGSSILTLLPGIAYLLHNWRVLQLAIISPNILLLGLCYWLLPESARWLLTEGKKEAAQKELQRAARVNGREIPETLLEKLEMETPLQREHLLHLFKISYLRKRVLILGFTWFSISLVYYALTLNVGSFGSNIYITQLIFGAIELPSHLSGYVLNERLGRRISKISFLVLGGVACLLILAIPEDLPVVVTVVAVFGKYSITGAFSTAYLYTAELFPTNLRQNGLGISSMFARVGGILAPLIGLLEVYHSSIPMLICGTFPIVAGGLCLLLPETKNMELRDCEGRNEDQPVNRELSQKAMPPGASYTIKFVSRHFPESQGLTPDKQQWQGKSPL
uniref:Solute carrier family 22 member 13b n=1 Tax=Takifugu rubripes TaxID=31033 RepID=H2V5V1_TAKRU